MNNTPTLTLPLRAAPCLLPRRSSELTSIITGSGGSGEGSRGGGLGGGGSSGALSRKLSDEDVPLTRGYKPI